MIPFFHVDCAHAKNAPAVEELLSIHKPIIPIHIHGLKFMPGDKPRAVIGKDGSFWCNCIGSRQSHFPIFFSDSVVRSVIDAGMTSLAAGEVELDSRKNRKLSASPIGLTYYQVGPLGKPLEFFYRVFERIGSKFEYRFETKDNGDSRLRPMAMPYVQQIQKIPLVESWDGSDFIRVSEKIPTYGSGGFYCSRRFVELAKKHQWSNLCFTPIDMIGTLGGDFLGRPWPPELWYPKSHPPSGFRTP